MFARAMSACGVEDSPIAKRGCLPRSMRIGFNPNCFATRIPARILAVAAGRDLKGVLETFDIKLYTITVSYGMGFKLDSSFSSLWYRCSLLNPKQT